MIRVIIIVIVIIIIIIIVRANFHFEGWSYQAQRETPGKFESSNLSMENLSREIGRLMYKASCAKNIYLSIYLSIYLPLSLYICIYIYIYIRLSLVDTLSRPLRGRCAGRRRA